MVHIVRRSLWAIRSNVPTLTTKVRKYSRYHPAELMSPLDNSPIHRLDPPKRPKAVRPQQLDDTNNSMGPKGPLSLCTPRLSEYYVRSPKQSLGDDSPVVR